MLQKITLPNGRILYNATQEDALERGCTQSQINAVYLDNHIAEVRIERNRRLAAADWTQMGDSPLEGANKSEWAQYRKDLRDLPATITSIDDQPIWPDEPGA